MVVKKVIPLVPAASAPCEISWCFKTLFILWMRFLGIELDPVCNPFRKITFFYGLLILFTCQWASISLTANGSFHNFTLPDVIITNTRSKNLNISKSATFGWNVWIDVINHFTLMGVVCPAFFYIAHSQRWIHLLDVMKKFHLAYCQRSNRGKISFAFVGFVPILSELGLMIYNLKTKLTNLPHASAYQISVCFFSYFAKMLPISALVLFCSVTWQSADFYGEIQRDVELLNVSKLKKENIRQWKRSLSLVDELVDRINECFGLILLVSITHFFVEFIARSFYFISSILSHQLEVVSIICMSSRIFLLWFIVYCPAKVRQNAFQVAISLHKIDRADVNLRKQVSFLAIDIIQNLPCISALDYFDVNLQLIPKLVGTTLTYLGILYQFQTSETDND